MGEYLASKHWYRRHVNGWPSHVQYSAPSPAGGTYWYLCYEYGLPRKAASADTLEAAQRASDAFAPPHDCSQCEPWHVG